MGEETIIIKIIGILEENIIAPLFESSLGETISMILVMVVVFFILCSSEEKSCCECCSE